MRDNVIARHLRDLAANTELRGNHASTLMTVTEAQALNDSEGFEYPVSGDHTTRWLWEDAMPHRVHPSCATCDGGGCGDCS